jgi:hypothetical protein
VEEGRIHQQQQRSSFGIVNMLSGLISPAKPRPSTTPAKTPRAGAVGAAAAGAGEPSNGLAQHGSVCCIIMVSWLLAGEVAVRTGAGRASARAQAGCFGAAFKHRGRSSVLSTHAALWPPEQPQCRKCS